MCVDIGKGGHDRVATLSAGQHWRLGSEGEVKALVGPTVPGAPEMDFVLYVLVRKARDPLWQDQTVITLEVSTT